MSYHLTGRFIECCNCKVICPCWVDDTPTEDHCAGFFAWTFDPGSTIDNHQVGNRHVVVVTVHSDPRRGGTSESVVFVDDRLTREAQSALLTAFAMDDPDRTDPLGELRAVLGFPVARQAARIRVRAVTETRAAALRVVPDLGVAGRISRARRRVERAPKRRAGFEVSVSTGGQDLVETRIFPEYFDASREPLTLNATALDAELKVQGPVRAHRTETLRVRVAALAGAGTELFGRSGMVGEFAYDQAI